MIKDNPPLARKNRYFYVTESRFKEDLAAIKSFVEEKVREAKDQGTVFVFWNFPNPMAGKVIESSHVLQGLKTEIRVPRFREVEYLTVEN